MRYRLNELKEWLINCNYPIKVIETAFHNALLQGPAPNPNAKNIPIPFVTNFYSNYSNSNIVNRFNKIVHNTNNVDIKNLFKDKIAVLSQKQPKNLLNLVTSSSLHNHREENGLFHCTTKTKPCNLCKLYIQKCSSFPLSNGKIWEIKCHITCKSKNVVYFLSCLNCDETYIGKTNNFRLRMNVHISSCRTGNTTDKFDKHVIDCNKDKVEPFFKIYAMICLKDEAKLLPYENYFHINNYDTMNRKY